MSEAVAKPKKEPARKKCGAKTRSGSPCQSWALHNGRCRMHGGNQVMGPLAGRWKTGKYSKYLPSKLVDKYLESQQDSELLSLRDEIAVLDSRIAELLARSEQGEGGQLWQDLNRRMVALNDHMRREDMDGIHRAYDMMRDLVDKGLQDYQIWLELRNNIEQRRRLVSDERKRLVDMQQIITSEQAILMVTYVVSVVRQNLEKHCPDSAIRKAVQAGIAREIRDLYTSAKQEEGIESQASMARQAAARLVKGYKKKEAEEASETEEATSEVEMDLEGGIIIEDGVTLLND